MNINHKLKIINLHWLSAEHLTGAKVIALDLDIWMWKKKLNEEQNGTLLIWKELKSDDAISIIYNNKQIVYAFEEWIALNVFKPENGKVRSSSEH